ERSDTGDAEGAIIERSAVPALSPAQVSATLPALTGSHQQVPPMYSALKRAGQPLYRLARRGIVVERAARSVQIERLQLLEYGADELQLEVVCSAGTYVRVLGEDIARALGTCGRLTSLRRLYVEPFQDEVMVELAALRALSAAAAPWPLLRADRAVLHLPSLALSCEQARSLARGQIVTTVPPTPTAVLWRLYDDEGRFLGLGDSDECGRLRSRRLFSAPLPVT
ncbi:MAG TPA: tRNA pseudouridine(55) synthase TruB, partial [Steroidobacteraceae bacterium]|nr:tRNA pseudouridine(55) synthase TruB [Steroidobacteraceae bacterium]